ncbi:hypothetical protein HIM_01039 [Hirsutella minnesotensis 3608]|nr:hypothetical protein HIM_01039 [Hirsutella minnesotensis 3608]
MVRQQRLSPEVSYAEAKYPGSMFLYPGLSARPRRLHALPNRSQRKVAGRLAGLQSQVHCLTSLASSGSYVAETAQDGTPENVNQGQEKANKPAAKKKQTNARKPKNVNTQPTASASNPVEMNTVDTAENIYDVSDNDAHDEDMDGVVQGNTMPKLPVFSNHAYNYKSILLLDTVEAAGAPGAV